MTATTAARERAVLYEASRPPYSPTIVDWLSGQALGGAAVVADIGCGTGLSTRILKPLAQRLIGVEPDAGMRAVATQRMACDAEIMAGSAEATQLPDASVDLLAAASCFEWFDPGLAATEFHRVLKPDGQVVLMWNHRLIIDEVTASWDRLWLRHMGPRLGPAPQDIEGILVPAFLEPDTRSFDHVDLHRYDRARLRAFAFSSGYAPRPLQRRRRQALLAAIDAFLDRHGQAGAVELAFSTVAFLGRPRTRPSSYATNGTCEGLTSRFIERPATAQQTDGR